MYRSGTGAEAFFLRISAARLKEAAERRLFRALRCAQACGSKELLFFSHLRHFFASLTHG